MRNGRSKWLLRRLLDRYLPESLVDRPKMGFGVPIDQWFRGPLREMTWDMLLGQRFLERGIVEPAFMRYLLEEHQSGRRSNHSQIYGLLMLELWRRNLEQPAASPENFAQCAALKK